MREKASPEDMNRVLVKLICLWEKYPHQRLGQLMLNLTRQYSEGETNKHVLWNLDEQELLNAIDHVREHGW